MGRLYEAMYVIRPDLPEEEVADIMRRTADAVVQAGGTVQLNEIYEKRALAYEIDGCVRGTYCLMYFESEGAAVDPLRHEMGLDEQILRYLVVLANPRAIWKPGGGVAPVSEAAAEAEDVEEPEDAEQPAEPEAEAPAAEPAPEEAPDA